MPKVLRIINRLNLGGPTYNASLLTKYLAPKYETLLAAGQKDDSEASSEHIPRQLGIEPVYIPDMHRSLHPLKDRRAYIEIKKLIKKFKPDIVHTHAAKAGAVGRLAAHHCKVPVILHTFHGHVFHSYFNPLKTKMFIQIERYLAGKSSKIIAISEKQKQEIGGDFKVCPLDKIQVIPLGFDLSKFRENQQEKRSAFRKKYGLSDDEVAVGIIGRLVPIKDHPFFLRAAKVVLEKSDQKVRFFIIGDGEEKDKLMGLCEELSLSCHLGENPPKSAQVIFTSWIKDVDVANAGLDIIALTSKNEGTPVSLIEAQASNRPIISTNVGGIEDVVLPGKTALLSERDDLNTFSDNLLSLISDPEKRQKMGAHGNGFVKDKFSYQRLAADMDKLYQSLLL